MRRSGGGFVLEGLSLKTRLDWAHWLFGSLAANRLHDNLFLPRWIEEYPSIHPSTMKILTSLVFLGFAATTAVGSADDCDFPLVGDLWTVANDLISVLPGISSGAKLLLAASKITKLGR